MSDNRMAPPPAARPRMATQLQRAQAEREQGYLWQTEVVGDGFDLGTGEAHFDAVLNQRERDGWELVGMVAWGEKKARLVYRRRAQ